MQVPGALSRWLLEPEVRAGERREQVWAQPRIWPWRVWREEGGAAACVGVCEGCVRGDVGRLELLGWPRERRKWPQGQGGQGGGGGAWSVLCVCSLEILC